MANEKMGILDDSIFQKCLDKIHKMAEEKLKDNKGLSLEETKEKLRQKGWTDDEINNFYRKKIK